MRFVYCTSYSLGSEPSRADAESGQVEAVLVFLRAAALLRVLLVQHAGVSLSVLLNLWP